MSYTVTTYCPYIIICRNPCLPASRHPALPVTAGRPVFVPTLTVAHRVQVPIRRNSLFKSVVTVNAMVLDSIPTCWDELFYIFIFLLLKYGKAPTTQHNVLKFRRFAGNGVLTLGFLWLYCIYIWNRYSVKLYVIFLA